MNKNNILDTDDNTREKRIKNLVNASELIHAKLNENENTNKSSKNNEKSIIEKIFYPFIENMPPVRKYSSTGHIININFNTEFKRKLNKDIIELEENNISPKWVSFTIKLENKNKTISKTFKIEKDKDKLTKFINYYGDTKIDSLIGSEVILTPYYDGSKYEKYDVLIPCGTATSKIKAKLMKWRTDIAPMSTQPNILPKYFALNLSRLLCTLLILFVTFGYIGAIGLMSFNYGFYEASTYIIFTPIIVLINGIIVVISVFIESKINVYKNGQEYHYLGDIERSLFTYVYDGISYIKKKIYFFDLYIGKRL